MNVYVERGVIVLFQLFHYFKYLKNKVRAIVVQQYSKPVFGLLVQEIA